MVTHRPIQDASLSSGGFGFGSSREIPPTARQRCQIGAAWQLVRGAIRARNKGTPACCLCFKGSSGKFHVSRCAPALLKCELGIVAAWVIGALRQHRHSRLRFPSSQHMPSCGGSLLCWHVLFTAIDAPGFSRCGLAAPLQILKKSAAGTVGFNGSSGRAPPQESSMNLHWLCSTSWTPNQLA